MLGMLFVYNKSLALDLERFMVYNFGNLTNQEREVSYNGRDRILR